VFPTVISIAALLAGAGLELVETVEVPEPSHSRATAHQAAAWIRMMRNADSLLLAFSDEEIAAGLDRLESNPEDQVLGPVRLGLAAFRLIS
jgi:hypothetical protein